MPRENVQLSANLSMPLAFDGSERRTVASYERELSEHRDTEIRLRQDLAHHQTLLVQKDEVIGQQEVSNQECHHRLLNNLQMIVGLLTLQSRTEANVEAASRLAVAAERVGAIARLHRHLHPRDGRQTVEFKEYLDELCRGHSTMSMSQDHPDQFIVVEGIELRLPTVTAIPLGLIANELITNAIKHGKGAIAVKLEPDTRKSHALSICNKGADLPERFDPRVSRGLGMSLVSALVKIAANACSISVLGQARRHTSGSLRQVSAIASLGQLSGIAFHAFSKLWMSEAWSESRRQFIGRGAATIPDAGWLLRNSALPPPAGQATQRGCARGEP
jgi:two-component sensor histidine kinase